MGGKGSKGPSEAEQRRILQIYTIKQGLANAQRDGDTHFENLVLESAGNKAVSYYGALKVMEEVGILTGLRRYAGVGAGAGWAMFLSIGLTPSEIAALKLDNELAYDAKFGMFAFMPNLAQKLGWSPLGKAAKIAQRVLEQRTGNPALTFKEVLDTYGKELCIVGTNLTTGSLEYFHPKTTPDIPIVDALVMSATLPGIMKPKYLLRGGEKHYIVDGGVLCNYCIHAFDGWYLSLKKEDSFLSRLSGNLEPPFKGYNDKTLGLVTVSPGDGDFGEQAFLRRLQYDAILRPNSKLARSKGAESQTKWERAVSQDQVQGAGQRLLQRLRAANINGHDQITVHDFQRALGEGSESQGVDDIQLLFGKTRDELTQIFEQLNVEREGKVTFDEFVEVALQQSTGLRQHLEGSGTSRQIRNMPDIFRAVLSAVEGSTKRAFLKEIDIIRSVGVNTDYVGALDPLEDKDKRFLVMQGEAACLAFLLEYTQKYAPQHQMQIYSALPARQNSSSGSIIDPDEMRDYSVPNNLYPTLPPSYASAIGDSDHLRDTIETNWPQPVGDYNYNPEKNPNMLYPQVPQQMPPNMPQHMPPQMPQPVPQPYIPPPMVGPDPWGIPQGMQPNVSQTQPVASYPQRSHQARVQVLPQANHSPQSGARIQVMPHSQPQPQVQVLPQANPQPQVRFQVLPQAQPTQQLHHHPVGQHPGQHRNLRVNHAPTAVGNSHFTVGIGQNSAPQQQRRPQQQQGAAVFQGRPQPGQQVILQATSPVMQRRQQPIAVIQGAPRSSPIGQQRHLIRAVQQQPQGRHHRQLAAHQAEQADVNHIVFVT